MLPRSYAVPNRDPQLGRKSIPLPTAAGNSSASPRESYANELRGHLQGVHRPSMLHFPPARAHGGAVIVCPGGGYQILSVTKEGRAVAEWLNALGFHVFVLKYRVAPHGHPNQFQDGATAMRLVRSRAADWDLDPTRIGAMGFSAGGHLVSMLSTRFNDLHGLIGSPLDRTSARPDWAALIYPFISLEPTITHLGTQTVLLGKNPDAEAIAALSTDLHVSAATPTTFILYSTDDRVTVPDHALRYHAALRRLGVPATLHALNTGGHGFGLGGPPSQAADWTSTLEAWMRVSGILPDSRS